MLQTTQKQTEASMADWEFVISGFFDVDYLPLVKNICTSWASFLEHICARQTICKWKLGDI